MLKVKMTATTEMYSSEVDTGVSPTKRRSRLFPENVLSSNMCRLALFELIDKLEGHEKTQSNIDSWYGLFCDTLLNEMKTKTDVSSRKGVNQQMRRTKPYWDSELKNSGMIKEGRERISKI